MSRQQKDLILLGSVIFCGVVFWMLNAPDFRFGSSLIYISLTITLIVITRPFVGKIPHNLFTIVFGILIAVFLIRKMHFKDATEYAIMPAPYKKTEAIITQGKGFSLAIPKKGFECWNYPVPCVPFGNISYLELRGEHIESGFRYIYPKKNE